MKPVDLFTEQELEKIKMAVCEAEKVTSGEIRVKIVSYPQKGFNLDQEALYQFYKEGLYRTKDKTGILILIILESKAIEIRADYGINEKVPEKTWDGIAERISYSFKAGKFCEGLCDAIKEVGELLKAHFPIQPGDVDELPDDVIAEK